VLNIIFNISSFFLVTISIAGNLVLTIKFYNTQTTQPMKNFASIIVLFVAIYSLTSCSSNRGHGCGYWSTTEIPQQEKKVYQFSSQTEPTCTDTITAD